MAATKPLTILYVEDNPVIREITQELLFQEQRQIVALGTAEEALDEFHKNPFDMVITDVSLPVMSGLDLVRSLLNEQPQLPIIICSGYSLDFGLENWGLNVRSVIKPFDGAQIDALIFDLMGS